MVVERVCLDYLAGDAGEVYLCIDRYAHQCNGRMNECDRTEIPSVRKRGRADVSRSLPSCRVYCGLNRRYFRSAHVIRIYCYSECKAENETLSLLHLITIFASLVFPLNDGTFVCCCRTTGTSLLTTELRTQTTARIPST
jgi:hypothetical protein